MAKNYEFEMDGHPNMNTLKPRKLKVYFSEPENGVDENTGIVLLIAGFGANTQSNVYKKMRNTFADKHNLITVQCDYFGWEFMQDARNIALNIDRETLENLFSKDEIKYIYKDNDIFQRLIEICDVHKVDISAMETLNENQDNYNEMGLVQAIDNVSAVFSVLEIIKDNGYEIDMNKIILYGQSHGAYLSYLSNAIAPNLFSLLIDNSAWLFPEYLKEKRYINKQYGQARLTVGFDYFAKKLDIDQEILYIPFLYSKFKNQCEIVCYHGTNDKLINHQDKRQLKDLVQRFNYNEVDTSQVDGEIFKSTSHGLGADFLKLFDKIISSHKFDSKNRDNQKNIMFETRKKNYRFSYEKGLPVLSIKKSVPKFGK
ncbi:DUF2920 family protein [Desemzia incerta]|uniref:DUF2920 family protein n=1 Tax=Desemzia incerta TaxID=82801 RepID=UPI0016602FA1|nr:DUF2920 family protein [Desemzia incerta]